MLETTPPPTPTELGFSETVAAAFLGDGAKVADAPSLTKASTAIDIVRALSVLGSGWITWEPETIWTEMKRALDVSPTDAIKAKVNAVKTLLVSNEFWDDHLAFEKVVVSLNGITPLFDQYQNPSPGMIAKALKQAAEIRTAPFSDEVLRFIAASCFEEGLVLLPSPLDVAQESLDELTAPVAGRALKEAISQEWARLGDAGAKDGMYAETPTGVQLARMKAIQEYANAA